MASVQINYLTMAIKSKVPFLLLTLGRLEEFGSFKEVSLLNGQYDCVLQLSDHLIQASNVPPRDLPREKRRGGREMRMRDRAYKLS